MKLLNNVSKIFKFAQRENYGGYDTFGYCSKGKKNRQRNNRRTRRRIKELDKFYEGFEEFINKKGK